MAHLPSSFPISYAVDGKQYIAMVRGQPSRFIGTLFAAVGGFLAEEGRSLPTPSSDPALMVYALD
jgi:hypothetical protein